jgi:methionyl-tRNA synthetase
VSGANLFVQQAAPWSLAKAGKEEELDQVLSALARALCRLAILSAPFMPSKAQALWQDLGLEGNVGDAPWEVVGHPPMEGRRTKKGAALFPKPATV